MVSQVCGDKYEELKLGDRGEEGLGWGNSINRMGAGWDALNANWQASSLRCIAESFSRLLLGGDW